jgi:hypothetical protein
MTYIEWLRVRNCLRTVAICLALLVMLAAVLRISFARYMSPNEWVQHISQEPGATETHATLPDGTKQTVIEDSRDHTHVVIADRGSAGTHIVITEPASRAHKDHSEFNIGSIAVNSSRQGGLETTTVDTNGSVPMLEIMALANVVALIVATVLAAPLAREIDGHLEIALTKPVSRIRYALGAIAADVAGIVAAAALTVLACYLCELVFGSYRVDVSGVNARAMLMGIAMPAAWYALLCAATTWFSRSYGAVLGFAWPVAIIVGVLTVIQPSTPLTLFIHDVGWTLSRLDPLTYVSLSTHVEESGPDTAAASFPMRFGMEILLFAAYAALALLRWERVEA